MGEFKPEAIGEQEAFQQGERQLEQQARAKVAGQVWVPVVGGPKDGARFSIPMALLQDPKRRRHAEFPFPVAEPTGIIVGEKHQRVAVYVLDPGTATLKFREITRLSAA